MRAMSGDAGEMKEASFFALGCFCCYSMRDGRGGGGGGGWERNNDG